jgi:hypothetical protein
MLLSVTFYCHAKCHIFYRYAEFVILSVIMLNVIMLSVAYCVL